MTEAKVVLREYTNTLGDAVDNEGAIVIQPLPRTTAEQLEQRQTIQADGLKLRLHYSLTHSDMP